MSYKIIDEPSPGPLAQFVVNPLWPMLAVMLCGSWLALPWFLFNGIAIGSPTLRREVMVVVVGLVGGALLGLGWYALYSTYPGSQKYIEYLFLVVIVWKLGICYWLYILQAQTIELYEYFGGKLNVMFGIILLFLTFSYRGQIQKLLYINDFWTIFLR